MNIPILYEDGDLVVIDKPAGITVNKSETTINQETVQEWAEKELRIKNLELRMDDEHDFYKRGGIVHRLDKETSGALIIAKNQASFEDLQRQFKERSIKKTYIALTHGKITPHMGEIDVPVGRLPWNRKQFGIIPAGRQSKTLYKVLNYYQDPSTKEVLSEVELYPQSGRTHQIRVHLKYLGRPIFSDFLYAGRKTARKDRKVLPRVFLHAAKLTFMHPTKKTPIILKSPLPPDLSKFLQKIVILKGI